MHTENAFKVIQYSSENKTEDACYSHTQEEW